MWRGHQRLSDGAIPTGSSTCKIRSRTRWQDWHINQGSMNAAADAYEAEYTRRKRRAENEMLREALKDAEVKQ